MKMTPLTASQAGSNVNPYEGRSAGPDRLAKAKQVAAGITVTEAPDRTPPADEQVEKVQNSIKRLKMRTQRSPDAYKRVEPLQVVDNLEKDNVNTVETPVVEAAPVDVLDTPEQVQAGDEATKPLAPQYAALAKAKRALQLQEQALAEREKALEGKSQVPEGNYTKDQIKANALSILRDAGVTNDELTEAILRESQDYGPGFTKLEAEIKSLKEALNNQQKTSEERESQQEQQVLRQMTKEAEALVSQGDDFELVRESGYVPKAIELVHKTFKKTGEVMDLTEALTLIENELLSDSLKFAQLKKVQAKLTPQQEQQLQAAKSAGDKTMRTLTNRDGTSSSQMSRRDRAIAVMEGRLK